MKTHKYKYLFSLLLTFCLLASMATAVNTGRTPVQPKYAKLVDFGGELSISSSGYCTLYCTASLYSSSDTVEVTMELQRGGGTSFTALKSWSNSGSDIVSLNESWNVSKGYEYRVYATARVYNSSGSLLETATTVSGTVFY